MSTAPADAPGNAGGDAAPAKQAPGGASPGRATRRGAARLAAVQAIYEITLSGADVDAVTADYIYNRWGVSAWRATAVGVDEFDLIKPDKALFRILVEGVTTETETLDEHIRAVLTGATPFERQHELLRAILRCGVYELTRRAETPPSTVIDEYVHVANAFFDDGVPGLVNAALDQCAKTLGVLP
ncbi:MAG: transcription antitermination factor NusB [Rhodospirillales bacterium]